MKIGTTMIDNMIPFEAIVVMFFPMVYYMNRRNENGNRILRFFDNNRIVGFLARWKDKRKANMKISTDWDMLPLQERIRHENRIRKIISRKRQERELAVCFAIFVLFALILVISLMVGTGGYF